MSDKPKFNPGPWTIGVQENEGYSGSPYQELYLKDGNGKCFSDTCFQTSEEDSEEEQERVKANMQLIASAPELLECLKEAVIELCGTHIHGDEEGDCHCFIREDWRCTYNQGQCFIQRWLAAIRKAEGLENQ